jgi:hypothetical protein
MFSFIAVEFIASVTDLVDNLAESKYKYEWVRNSQSSVEFYDMFVSTITTRSRDA